MVERKIRLPERGDSTPIPNRESGTGFQPVSCSAYHAEKYQGQGHHGLEDRATYLVFPAAFLHYAGAWRAGDNPRDHLIQPDTDDATCHWC